MPTLTLAHNRTMKTLLTLALALVTFVSGVSMSTSNAHAFAALSSGSSVSSPITIPDNDYADIFNGRTVLGVKACDLATRTSPNKIVDVGFGDRQYWAYTNEYSQVVGLYAENIVLQEKSEELSNGRYCWDQARTDSMGQDKGYDAGHIVADSLGGASNIFNITPQNSYLNRYGEQYRMEERIRKAGGAQDFSAQIIYPNKNTDIPSEYIFSFTRNDGVYENLSFKNQG